MHKDDDHPRPLPSVLSEESILKILFFSHEAFLYDMNATLSKMSTRVFVRWILLETIIWRAPADL